MVDVSNYLECCFFGTVTWPTLLYRKTLLSETCGVYWSPYGKLQCDVYNYLQRLLTSLTSVVRSMKFSYTIIQVQSPPPRNTLRIQYENQMVKACATEHSLPTVRITANSQMQYTVRPRSFINSKFRWYTLLPLRFNETWIELSDGIVTVLIQRHKETGWTNCLPNCCHNTLTHGHYVTWNSPLLTWHFQWLVYLKIERFLPLRQIRA
jgi:hypothetical protein